MRILIVDDEKVIREGIVKAIDWSSYNIEVSKARNGEEALEVMKIHQVDIIITDVRMPIMGGLELCKKLREMGSAVHIIILSGYDDFEYARTAIQYRVDAYLLKPVGIKKLTEEVLKIKENMVHDAQDFSDYDYYVSETMKYIHGHVHEQLKAVDLADRVKISSDYLSKLFKKDTGKSLSEWILDYRIEMSQRIIKEMPYLKVYELAYKVGFSDYKYFSKIFRNKIGCSVKAYIKSGESI